MNRPSWSRFKSPPPPPRHMLRAASDNDRPTLTEFDPCRRMPGRWLASLQIRRKLRKHPRALVIIYTVSRTTIATMVVVPFTFTDVGSTDTDNVLGENYNDREIQASHAPLRSRPIALSISMMPSLPFQKHRMRGVTRILWRQQSSRELVGPTPYLTQAVPTSLLTRSPNFPGRLLP
jgi:hypothetical protein